MPHNMRDRVILALTCYGEARNETDAGVAAVAWTVLNRSNADLWKDKRPDWWGEGVANVCLKSWQYSCWNTNDPNRAKMLGLLVGGDLTSPTPTHKARADPVFVRCLKIAENVLDGHIPDPTHGATHYYASYIPEPSWARGKTPSVVIGVHRFYNDVEPGYEAPREVPASVATEPGPPLTLEQRVAALETIVAKLTDILPVD